MIALRANDGSLPPQFKIPGPPVHDPQVQIDHDVAVVWAPFNFYIDGKLDHCGRDLISLNQKNGKWKIVALAATTRTDCTAN
jgi:hypothetical protein